MLDKRRIWTNHHGERFREKTILLLLYQYLILKFLHIVYLRNFQIEVIVYQEHYSNKFSHLVGLLLLRYLSVGVQGYPQVF